jgi:hypothetical protein
LLSRRWASKMMPKWLEKPNQDQRLAAKFTSTFKYNKLKVFHYTKLHQPKSGLVVTISLEFLDKYGMQLHNCPTHYSLTTKTQGPLQSFHPLLHTMN